MKTTTLTDTRRLAWLGLALVLGGLGLFFVWAAVAPLDEGVVAPGVVQTEAKRKPIQHPVVAVIAKVHVREGDAVRAGDLLVQLDDAQVSASHLAARSQFLALKAAESRLVAESAGAGTVTFETSGYSAEDVASAREYMERERRLFLTRRAALDADLSVLEQSVVSAREQERAFAAQLDGRRKQFEMVTEQIKSSRELAQAGFISRTRLLDEERVAVDLAAQVSELVANIDRIRATAMELKLRAAQRKREFAREVDASAAETRRELGSLVERLAGTKAEVRRAQINAPTDGTVVGLAIQSPGAVVPEGARIMDIVPRDEGLVIEAQISPDVIERVHAGLPADVRFPGFPDMPFLAINGKVASVSADRIEESTNRPAHFLARVQITPEGMSKLGKLRIQPGMSAEVVIRTGERTLLAYVLKPLVRRATGALTER